MSKLYYILYTEEYAYMHMYINVLYIFCEVVEVVSQLELIFVGVFQLFCSVLFCSILY